MRNILLAAGVTGLLGLFSACSSKDHAAVAPDAPQNGGGTHTTLGGSHSTAGKPNVATSC